MDPTSTTSGNNSTNGHAFEAPSEPSIRDVFEALSKLADRVEKHETRFGDVSRELGRMGKKMRSGTTESMEASAEPTPSKALTNDDLFAALQLGELKAGLPEAGKQFLAAQQEKGLSIAELSRLAEGMACLSNKGGTSGAAPDAELKAGLAGTGEAPVAGTGARPRVAPPGTFSASAPRTSPALPRTQVECVEVAKSDPARWKAVQADPTFNMANLPYR